MTYKEATELKAFVFNHKGDIEETNYAEHVLQSQDECTHHTGVMPTYSVQEIENEQENENGTFEMQTVWATVSRNSRQRGYSIDKEFDTEEEANNYWFNQIEKSDYQKDDQRDTSFYYTWTEIAQVLAEKELN